MGDLLGMELFAKETIYRALDQLVEHKADLFSFLRERWEDLFNARFDVLLYDLYSESQRCRLAPAPLADTATALRPTRHNRSLGIKIIIPSSE